MPTKDTPDNAPSVVEAYLEDMQDYAKTLVESGKNFVSQTHTADADFGSSAKSSANSQRASLASARHDVTVTFADVDAMSKTIGDLRDCAVPIVSILKSTMTDHELVASTMLSLATGCATQVALLASVSGLSTTIVVTDALAIITATVVSTYQFAETTISASAANLKTSYNVGFALGNWALTFNGAAINAGIDSTLAGATFTSEIVKTIVTAQRAVGDLLMIGTGLGEVYLGASRRGEDEEKIESLKEAKKQLPRAPEAGHDPVKAMTYAVSLAQRAAENYSESDALGNANAQLENSLGKLGNGRLDFVLSHAIRDGHTLGLFDEGVAVTVKPREISAKSTAHARKIAGKLWDQMYSHDGEFNRNSAGLIEPNDVSSLLASAAQIDQIGSDKWANIRIIKSDDGAGNIAYTVQIPSTQRWWPTAGALPNDLTSDLYAMRFGAQTQLANSVLAAMAAANIPIGPGAPPVMLAGFSLGGLTAAAIAASPQGFNIKQVIVAGAPIGTLAIPHSTAVLALEARQDKVPYLDSTRNSGSWTTIQENAHSLAGEKGRDDHKSNAHDARRYAMMAVKHPEVNHDPKITKYFQGTITVTDYSANRTQ